MELLNDALSNDGTVTDSKKVVEAYTEIKFVLHIMNNVITPAIIDGYSTYRDKHV